MTKVLFDLLSQSGSIVPIRSGKGSDPGWNEFQTKAPTPEELDAWITSGDYEGYALMMGYGGYHVIDVDTKNASEEVKRDLFQKVWAGVPSHLREKLTVQRTRSGGEHIIYRCPTPTYPEKLITNPIEAFPFLATFKNRGFH